MVWKWIFNAEYGIINQIIGSKDKLADQSKAGAPCLCGGGSLGAVGYDAVLLLSGIQNISKATMRRPAWTGPQRYSSFFKITLPMVSPTLFVVLIMRLMASIKVYDLILHDGGPDQSRPYQSPSP